MNTRRLLVTSIFIVIVVIATSNRQETFAQNPQEYAVVQDEAKRFLTAFFKWNTDEVMKLVDVPFLFDTEIVRDKNKLKNLFTETFSEKTTPKDKAQAQAKRHIRKIYTLRQFAEDKKFAGTIVLQLFSKVLDNDGRIVLIELELDGDSQGILIAVRLKKDGAKIVGFND